MLKYGVISEESGFRDLYDPDIKPSTFEEFAFGTRWFHTAQAAVLKYVNGNVIVYLQLFHMMHKI